MLRPVIALAASSLCLLASRAALGGDLDVATGPAIGASGGNGWSGDGAIPYWSFRAAYRFDAGIGPVILTREGYAATDERVLTLLTLGAQGWLDLHDVKPWLRIAWAHQHEESLVNAQAKPFGVLFGVGRGVRHRGGASFGAGADVPFLRKKDITWFVAGEAWADWFFADDAPGPRYYVGGTLSIGLDYRL